MTTSRHRPREAPLPKRDLPYRLGGGALIIVVTLAVLWGVGSVLQPDEAKVPLGADGQAIDFERPDVDIETPNPDGRGVGLREGNLAPDFAFTDFTGTRSRLSSYRGRAVLLNFWASWCLPCRAELPAMDTLLRQYGDARLAVLAVNNREPAGIAAAFIRRLEVDLTAFVYDPSGDIARRYAVEGLPTSYFIDPNGVITRLIAGQLSPAMMQSGVDDALSSGQ